MIKHFATTLPMDTYNRDLEEAASVLRAEPEEVLSIKIRPIKEQNGQYVNEYVYGSENGEFLEYLSSLQGYKVESNYSSAIVENATGQKVLFSIHESGPEFFLLAVQFMEHMNTISDFVEYYFKAFIRKNDELTKEYGRPKYGDVSLEVRTYNNGADVEAIVKISQADNVDWKQLRKTIKAMGKYKKK
ncbi:hypothetical protein [Flaviaesturariibacter amylovorans]|uniref:Uncharacterized protein n=1 Tax=Flaviaesturariibacter amylovorans TaxID=1084520 RepID=A0ABP8H6T0_9BACT